jgi:hypothetical protein
MQKLRVAGRTTLDIGAVLLSAADLVLCLVGVYLVIVAISDVVTGSWWWLAILMGMAELVPILTVFGLTHEARDHVWQLRKVSTRCLIPSLLCTAVGIAALFGALIVHS